MDEKFDLGHPSRNRSWIEIDLDAVGENIRLYRSIVGPQTKIMAMVKANAYGHGAVESGRAALAAGANRLGVATCFEGEELRSAGIDCPVQVLGALLPEEVESAVENDLIVSIHDLYIARVASLEAIRQNRDVTVHVKLDTGMGRLGILPEKMSDVLNEIRKLPRLQLEGLFMHMADAVNEDFTRSQLARFVKGYEEVRKSGINIPLRHVANSAGIFKYRDAHFEMVRPGISIYGVIDKSLRRREFPVRPVMSWYSHVIQVKDYPVGSTLGYGSTFVTSRPTRVAVLPVGYADGYRRSFSNNAEILVRGKRAPVIGRISMDYTMIDVSDIEGVTVGSVATLIGFDGDEHMSAEELASHIAGFIPHEILTGISPRVGRRYIGSETLVKMAARYAE